MNNRITHRLDAPCSLRKFRPKSKRLRARVGLHQFRAIGVPLTQTKGAQYPGVRQAYTRHAAGPLVRLIGLHWLQRCLPHDLEPFDKNWRRDSHHFGLDCSTCRSVIAIIQFIRLSYHHQSSLSFLSVCLLHAHARLCDDDPVCLKRALGEVYVGRIPHLAINARLLLNDAPDHLIVIHTHL